MTDTLDRFTFEHRSIRGELVTLEKTYKTILGQAEYPQVIQALLGELMAATSLLMATLKFEGEIGLQIQSEGAVSFALVSGTNEFKLRGVARWDESADALPDNFRDLFSKGLLSITLTPKEGKQYQGIVALDKHSLGACLEDYFLQSEQLLTSIYLGTKTGEDPRASGLFLQIIPKESPNLQEQPHIEPTEDYEHVTHLARTLSNEELLSLEHKEIIRRLYHRDTIRLHDPQTIEFGCDCSRERSANALRSMKKEELLNIIKEDGKLELGCQFCMTNYVFDEIDIENIHSQNMDSGTA